MKEFSSFASFADHLLRTAAVGEEVTHHLAEKSGEIVQKNAQNRLGEYQDYTGPFNSWAPLADSTKADRAAKGFPEDEPELRTGELRDSIEVKAQGNEAVIGSDSDIALYQELGTDKMPPRPFLGPAIYDSKLPIGELSATTIIAWVCGLGWRRPAKIALPGASIE